MTLGAVIGWFTLVSADLLIVVPLHAPLLVALGSGMAAGYLGAAIGSLAGSRL